MVTTQGSGQSDIREVSDSVCQSLCIGKELQASVIFGSVVSVLHEQAERNDPELGTTLRVPISSVQSDSEGPEEAAAATDGDNPPSAPF